MTAYDQLATSILDGKPATEDDALAVLRAHDDELIEVVAAAGRLRREHFGNTVKVIDNSQVGGTCRGVNCEDLGTCGSIRDGLGHCVAPKPSVPVDGGQDHVDIHDPGG